MILLLEQVSITDTLSPVHMQRYMNTFFIVLFLFVLKLLTNYLLLGTRIHGYNHAKTHFINMCDF